VNDSPSIFARMRAGLAGLLSRLAAGAHWLEARTAGGMRPIVFGLVGLAVLGLVVFGIMHEARVVGHAWSGDRAHHGGPPPPAPKPGAKPEVKPEQRSAGRQQGREERGQADRAEVRREGGPAARPNPPAPPPPPPPPPAAPGSSGA